VPVRDYAPAHPVLRASLARPTPTLVTNIESAPFSTASARLRVAAVHRTSLELLHDGALHAARLPASLIRDPDPLARPGVGDWVTATRAPNDDWQVTAVEPRRTALVRRAAGEDARAQMLAANVDVGLLFAPLPDDVNPRRLARLAALAFEGGILPVVVLSRRDLVPDEAVQAAIREVEGYLPGVPCVAISALRDGGVDALAPWLRPATTIALLGPSGAGKSTLVNRLAGAVVMPTGVTSGDGHGRHTTTHRALILLPGDVTVVDTPGVREVGMWTGGVGHEHVFADIAALATHCRFADCAHDTEPGCAVRAAADVGTLDPDRLAQWRELQREVAWAERSVHEQRRMQRLGSRLVKEVKRQKGY